MKTDIFYKILTWWFYTAVFGYLTGAVAISFGGLNEEIVAVYFIGIYIAGFLAAVMLFPFLILNALWFWFCHKVYNLDKSSVAVIFLTAIIGLIAGAVLYYGLENDYLIFGIGFLGGFLGSLIPRFTVKGLKPGEILKITNEH
jgi:hypothetical protein